MSSSGNHENKKSSENFESRLNDAKEIAKVQLQKFKEQLYHLEGTEAYEKAKGIVETSTSFLQQFVKQEKVQASLKKIGLSSSEEIDALKKKISQLERELNKAKKTKAEGSSPSSTSESTPSESP